MTRTVRVSGLVLFFCVGNMRAQNGFDDITLQIAKANGDNRTLAQIHKDNDFINHARAGNLDGVRQALKNGALVNSRYIDATAFLSNGASGRTALMRASQNGHEAIVKVLIEANADLEIEYQGRTATDIAAMMGEEGVIMLLAKAGAKGDPVKKLLTGDLIRAACKGFKIRDGEGYPPYPGAIGDPEKAPAIADVLKRGADVNAADSGGYTALMYAANLGRIDNVKILLDNGADATRKSKKGETALSIAQRDSSVAVAERRQVVELLRAHLAKKP